MFLLVDNYDSFTYNLVQAFAMMGETPVVIRNDEKTIEEIITIKPSKIAISPGPGTPDNSGISRNIIREFGSKGIPILGICLGHQCIAEVFGGKIVRTNLPMHGKTSNVKHDGTNLFQDLPNPFSVMRYHSLIVDETTFLAELEITATTEDGTIMGLAHRTLPIYGVQFHPESILTPNGNTLLRNFLQLSDRGSK